jgi:hypothetical protein
VMGQLISQARSDLAQLGVSDPQIELHAFDTLMAFAEDGLPGFLRDIDGEDHEPIPTSLLVALPPHDEACVRCLPTVGVAEEATRVSDANRVDIRMVGRIVVTS